MNVYLLPPVIHLSIQGNWLQAAGKKAQTNKKQADGKK